MNLLIGALTIGCIMVLLGLGVFLSFRILDTVDLTADGAFGVGAAVAGALLVRGAPPLVATVGAAVAGALAGVATGVIHTRLLVSALLAGVLTSTALYSVSLTVMGSGNLPLVGTPTLVGGVERIGARLGVPAELVLFDATVDGGSVTILVAAALAAASAALLLGMFLGTDLGLAMRAAGDNPPMARAVGIDVGWMVVLGLALANGLIALSGALLAQYEGLANIQMGVGALVAGLGGLLVGETLVGRRPLMRWIAGVLLGTVLLRLLVAAAIRAGLHPNALKLITAGLVLAVLALPHLLSVRRVRHRHA